MVKIFVAFALAASTAIVGATTAHAGPPSPCVGQVCSVDTSGELVQALDELGDFFGGTNRIELTGNITLPAGLNPTYDGLIALTIDGNDTFRLDGLGGSRILDITGVATVTFEAIEITGGASDTGGGVISAVNHVVFQDSDVHDNAAAAAGEVTGGAVTTGGQLTVTNSTIARNTATSTGDNASGGFAHSGDLITITGSTLTDNKAESTTGEARGGAIRATDRIEVTDSTLTGNDADASGTAAGGAIAADSATTIDSSTLEDNEALSATGTATGGGLHATATVSIIDSSFLVNQARGEEAVGGGAANVHPGIDVIDGALFWENGARGRSSDGMGGALALLGGGDTRVFRSSVRDNGALSDSASTSGGGIYTTVGDLSVFHSSVVRNYASETTGTGGGISTEGELALYNSTLGGNFGPTGSGAHTDGDLTTRYATVVANKSIGPAPQLSVGDDYVATATVVADPDPLGADQVNSAITDNIIGVSHNYDTDGTCGFAGTSVSNGPSPLLSPLRDNGGALTGDDDGPMPPTLDSRSRISSFPLAGSPLIDVLEPGPCDTAKAAVLGLDDDQRDVPRPFGENCDIGAIESVFPAHGFTDVTPFYEPTVRWITSPANDPNILDGFDDDTFRHRENITRGQVVRMYYRAAGAPDVTGLPGHGFDDVTPFFEDAVRWAKDEGIFDGFDDGTFRQKNPISRGNFTRSLFGFASMAGPPPATGPHGFSDVTPFYEAAVSWAAANGLADGFNDNTFRQARQINRGNASRITYNLAQSRDAWGAATPGIPISMIFRSTLP